jgi:hypothetical protein
MIHYWLWQMLKFMLRWSVEVAAGAHWSELTSQSRVLIQLDINWPPPWPFKIDISKHHSSVRKYWDFEANLRHPLDKYLIHTHRHIHARVQLLSLARRKWEVRRWVSVPRRAVLPTCGFVPWMGPKCCPAHYSSPFATVLWYRVAWTINDLQWFLDLDYFRTFSWDNCWDCLAPCSCRESEWSVETNHN